MITRRFPVQIATFAPSRRHQQRASNGRHPGTFMVHVHDVSDCI